VSRPTPRSPIGGWRAQAEAEASTGASAVLGPMASGRVASVLGGAGVATLKWRAADNEGVSRPTPIGYSPYTFRAYEVSSSRKFGWAMAISRFARSRKLWPNRSATPYSVTM
jgi:hypothetical protein